MSLIEKQLNGARKTCFFQWDCMRGIRGRDEKSVEALLPLFPDKEELEQTFDPALCLDIAGKLPEVGMIVRTAEGTEVPCFGSVLFALNMHRFLESPRVLQGVWNLRDRLKQRGCMLVILSHGFTLPPELYHDVVVIDDPLPTPDELEGILLAEYGNAGVGEPDAVTRQKGVEALRGLAAFPAEQAVAMSMTTKGVNLDSLWDQKRAIVSQIPGLSFSNATMTYADIGGLFQIKEFLTRIFNGRRRPSVVVYLEEMDKMFAGSGGEAQNDTGVSQDALGVILETMEERGWTGLIALGPPGSGKSLTSTATGNEFGVPTIKFDMGATRNKWVGESEQNIRAAMKTLYAIGGENVFFFGSANSIQTLRPELIRRFRAGQWMFDFPSAVERESIWKINLSKFGLGKDAGGLPDDGNWTGADIRNCCEVAWMCDIPLRQAVQYITPVYLIRPERVDSLRRSAHGRFLSASDTGLYRYLDDCEKAPGGRSYTLGE
jgi:hypothetical protein